MRFANGQSRSCVALILVLSIGRLGPGVAQIRTDATDRTGETSLGTVVVTAKRHIADEQVTEQVEKALADDPYIYAEHVTVTTNSGVIRIEGIVGDAGERFRILRRCRKMPGVRRVVDALEVMSNDPDGG